MIRGEDHVSNTGTQIEIFEALGGAVPFFAHHNMLTGAEGEGLSKRLGSLSLAELRGDGFEALAVALVAVLTGTSLPVEPYRRPRIGGGKARPAYDLARPGALRSGRARKPQRALAARHKLRRRSAALAAFGSRARRVGNPARQSAEILRRGDLGESRRRRGRAPTCARGRPFLAEALELLPAEPWDETTWSAWTNALKVKSGRKGRALFHPLRLALTGREDGPELKSLLPLLGRKVCQDRLS